MHLRYLKLLQKTRPEKKKIYHENAKPKKLQNLYPKRKRLNSKI